MKRTFEQLQQQVREKYPEAGNLIYLLTLAFAEGYEARDKELDTMKQTFTYPGYDAKKEVWIERLTYGCILLCAVVAVTLLYWAFSADINDIIEVTAPLGR